ncbi:MAG: hypothetical protein KDA21_11855 [Phycisphaerales bacterium]|nr:hypothetical protein [Phycisphaerales bacterium]
MTMHARPHNQFRHARRGTMLVVALGVLAIIAIAAASYVTIARVERNSAAAVARQVNYQQQVNAHAAEIGAVLAADLFGNKLTTVSTPRYSGSGAIVHPRMFEDGEFSDAPSTHIASLRSQERLGVESDPNRYALAIEDNAWLASTEPNWGAPSREWNQVSNLRSMYRFNESAQRWERQDGLYADLGEFFEDDLNNFGNAGADLNIIDPIQGIDTVPFELQMAELEPPYDQFTERDMRQFVDTDGDLRPDARWQQSTRLGNLYGLVWLEATRIVDASALVNYNASIEFGSDLQPGDGSTPADVDLWRLLRDARTFEHDDIRTDRLNQTFRNHIETSLDVPGLFDDLNDPTTYPRLLSGETLPTYQAWDPNSAGGRLTPEQRELFYRYAGATPRDPVSVASDHYPLRDLIDLQGYWGTNNGLVLSEIEATIDGPEVGGYLPPAQSTLTGPLRALEDALDARNFSQADPQPSSDAIFQDRRHLLTPVSGVADFSPIPAINYRDTATETRLLNRKVRLTGFQKSDLDESFNAFVWALAPLATDMSLGGELTAGDILGVQSQGSQYNYHYGGGNRSPAQALMMDPDGPMIDPEAAFAVRTAVNLTVNLLDASDGPQSSNTNDGPTILRAFTNFDYRNAGTITVVDNPYTPEIEFDPRLTHGDLNPDVLPIEYAGQQLTVGEAGELATRVDSDAYTYAQALRRGTTHVGLDRQPFLREVSTVAVYSDAAADGGNQDYTVDMASEQIGAVLCVELGNPWGVTINTLNYVVVLPDSTNAIGADSQILVLPSQDIAPGANHVFYFAWDNSTSPSWSGQFAAQIPMAIESLVPSGTITPFASRRYQDAAATPDTVAPYDLFTSDAPVLLMYEDRYDDTVAGITYYQRYLVDRMTPSPVPASDVPATLNFIDPGSRANIVWANSDEPYNNVDYFVDNHGYDRMTIETYDAIPPEGQRILNGITGRVMITQTLQRSDVQPLTGGFPSWIIEPETGTREGNAVSTPIYDVQAWLADLNTFYVVPFPGSVPDPPLPPDGAVLADSIMSNPADRFDLGNNKTLSTMELSSIPSWQLFVPNRDLIAPTELHMLCSFNHICLNHDLTNLDAWSTIGEQLGKARRYDFVNQTGGTNPYMGVLDPSRFAFGVDGMGTLPRLGPASLYVPLATRVLDCFEGLNLLRARAEGRININTAPENVLALLPFVEPDFDIIGPGGGSVPRAAVGASDDPGRVLAMINYREEPRDRANILGTPLANVRADGRRGFASIGELAILGRWEADGRVSTNRGERGFLELADGGNDNGYPIERHTEYASNIYNPVDDAEERLTIARAVANIATTRSDVFIAWFVLRGYNPDTIESIPVSGDALASMDDERFRPEYESRWLAVFDRSNVTTPTDRPELLLLIELPVSN